MKSIASLKQMLLVTALALAGIPAGALAGSFTADFNSGLPPGSAVFGNTTVSPNDGTGGGYTNSGCLQLTTAAQSQTGGFLLDDLDAGTPVVSFTAAFKVLIGGGTGADGFSFNFAPDLPQDTMTEEGAGTGITVEFDTFINDSPDTAPSIDIKVGGIEYTNIFCEGLRAGAFVDAVVQLNPNNTLDVIYDGVYIYSNLDLTPYNYTPQAASRFGFGSRTGGSTDNHFIDNLSIVTRTQAAPFVQSFAPRGRKAQTNSAIDIVLTDNTTQVDTNSIALTMDGARVSPVITTNGLGDTLIRFFAPPGGLASSSFHSVSLGYADNATPTPGQFTWDYSFTVADPPFVPGQYTTVFSDDFESYQLGAIDKDPMYWVSGNGPNFADNGVGNPWFGPRPPNAQIKTAENNITPHSGSQMISGAAPGDYDQNWLNLAYRFNHGQAVKGNCRLDWWFYDPMGNSLNAADFQDYVALCYYNTAPTNTDYPESSVPEDNANLNSGLVVDSKYQRLSLGGSVNIPDRGAYDASRYQARIVGASVGYAFGWANTSKQRSVGWHHASIVLGPPLADGTVNVYFYIDDMATPAYSGNSVTSSGFNVIEINSGQAAAVGYFDDFSFAMAGAPPPPPLLGVTRTAGGVVLTWTGIFTLQSAPAVTGPWNDLTTATGPYTFDTTGQKAQFFRLRN